MPVALTGQSIGVKGGGKLVQQIRKVTIKAFPKHLVDKITVDITDLDVNKTIRVGDIKVANVEVLGSKSIPIVTVVSPRALKAAAGQLLLPMLKLLLRLLLLLQKKV